MKKTRNNLKDTKYYNSGIELWKKAEKIIPGGNGLLSKRPQRYLPDFWPTYYKRSKKLNIWDLNGKKYTDMAQMGVGTCILGYSNDEINKKIIKSIKEGNNSTLNSKDEFILAKKLLKIDKFAEQVKFARGGGEAIDIAIRIARASTKRDNIIFSGYHGWYDWYLATNLTKKNGLKDHLLPGLDPMGVPKKLKNTVRPLKYNDIEELIKIKNPKSYAAFILEPCRFFYPKKRFIKKVNEFCEKNKICLIVDEITTGFRETLGGVYKKVGLNPDIVVYGKGLGNGHPISCIVGKKKFLKYSNQSFISSTAWTERSGFVAACAVIDFIKNKRVTTQISKNGKFLKKEWIKISNKNKIDISVSEFDALPTFYFNYGKQNEKLYTIFTYEMLKRNYLASNSVYLSYAHKKRDLKKYLLHFDKVLKLIKRYIDGKVQFNFKTRYQGFKRLN